MSCNICDVNGDTQGCCRTGTKGAPEMKALIAVAATLAICLLAQSPASSDECGPTANYLNARQVGEACYRHWDYGANASVGTSPPNNKLDVILIGSGASTWYHITGFARDGYTVYPRTLVRAQGPSAPPTILESPSGDYTIWAFCIGDTEAYARPGQGPLGDLGWVCEPLDQ